MNHTHPHLTIAIIARNEASGIAATIRSLAEQDLIAQRGMETDLIVLANGCTDATANVARQAIDDSLAGRLRKAQVVETPIGGKSRAWNIVVHEVADPGTDLFLFIDADIELADSAVCRDLLERLLSDPAAVAGTGRPTKQIARKRRKSVADRVSLAASEAIRAEPSINGSLYCVRASALQDIWLPEPTPGEDGFLNAMIQTRGFSAPSDGSRVIGMDRVTHYYEPAPFHRILAHEQRMIVGTAVNIWLFEHFMALRSTQPVGPLIGERNAKEPGWVGTVVRQRAAGRVWVVPSKLLFWRLPTARKHQPLALLRRLPVSILGAAFTFAAALSANARLKQESAAGYW